MSRFNGKIFFESLASIMLCLSFAGCAVREQPAVPTETGDLSGDNLFYNVSVLQTYDLNMPLPDNECLNAFYVFEDPENALTEVGNGFYISSENRLLVGDKYIAVDDIYYEMETDESGEINAGNYIKIGEYIWIVKEDGKTEEYYLNEGTEDSGEIVLSDRILGYDDGRLLILRHYNNDKSIVCSVDSGNEIKALAEVPEYCEYERCYYDNGKCYFTGGDNYFVKNLHVLDTESGTVNNYDLDFFVNGRMYDASGNSYIFGFDGECLCVTDTPEGKNVKKIPLKVNPNVIYTGAININGDIYLTDGVRVWFIRDEEVFSIRLSEYDIVTDSVYGMQVDESGFTLYSFLDEKEYIHKFAQTEEKHDKKEIRFATTSVPKALEAVVVEYNLQDPEYRVVLETRNEDTEYEDYLSGIELEMLDGNGPDILTDGLIENIGQMAARGFLEPLDDIVDNAMIEENDFIPAAFTAGQIYGHQYGIPMTTSLEYCIVSGNIIGERETWNLKECIEAVRNSDYSYFGSYGGFGMSGEQIIMFLGLYDKSNKKLIDWDERVSNLENETFVELLNFAKDYGFGDDSFFNTNTEEGKQKLTKIACGCKFNSVTDENSLIYDTLKLRENPIWIGYPSDNNSEAYLYTSCMYVNSKSNNKEGVKRFIEYFISKEGQDSFARNYLKYDEPNCMLSVRMSVADRYLRERTQFVGRELSEVDKSNYKEAILNSRPIQRDLDEIYIIVEEELGAFLVGQKTAEETAKIIDSRVQLYLDETKN